MLFSAHLGSMLSSFLASVILARVLEPAAMGRFAFAQSVLLVSGLFFEFGLFAAGARVLALARDRDSERRALGALILLAAGLGFAFSIFLLLAARPVEQLFAKGTVWLLTALAAPAFFIPFQILVEQSCQGLNQIRRLSAFQSALALLNLLGVAGLALAGRLNAGTALAAYLAALGAATVYTLAALRPRFRGVAPYLRLTLEEARRYGVNIYLARITGTVSTRIDNLIIAYFVALGPLGLYAIAQKLASPIATMARVLAITRFRAFATLERIPARLLRWNFAAVAALSGGLALVGPFALRLVFPKYAEAATLLVPFALWNLFAGLFQPYNMFLTSHGRGAELRNIAMAVTATNLGGLILAVPRYGIAGAAWVGVLAMLVDYLLHIHYYRRFQKLHERPSVETVEPPSPAGSSSSHASTQTASQARRALLLDLSGNRQAAGAWAGRNLPGGAQLLDKAELKWQSKRAALAHIRALRPETFAIFTADLDAQAALRAMKLFAVLAGARRVVVGDLQDRTHKRGAVAALLFEAPRLALEYLAGYLGVLPISRLETRRLRAALAKRRAPACLPAAPVEGRPMAALYLRATIIPQSKGNAAAGGLASHAAGFQRGATALGHRLRFIAASDAGIDEGVSPLDLIRPSAAIAPTRAVFELANNLRFTQRARRLIEHDGQPRFDFIYQRYSRFNWTGAALKRQTGLPLALEYNGSEVWAGRNWDPVDHLDLLEKFERLNLEAADRIFVVSEVERRNLMAAGVAGEKIVVNPNGVDAEEFRPGCGGDEVRRALGLEGSVVVGFLGTFGPWHGAPVLAEAAARIGNDACHFLFIGDGDERARAEQILAAAGRRGRATFVGRIAHAEVAAYLDACDILASPHVPSRDGSEFFGSPTKLFEYLAMERAVVASRLGQIGDVIEDGVNGVLVEPGDAEGLARALDHLAKDEALRRRLGEAARRTAIERYTWRQNAARVFDSMAALKC